MTNDPLDAVKARWNHIQGSLFPWLREEVDRITEALGRLVTTPRRDRPPAAPDARPRIAAPSPGRNVTGIYRTSSATSGISSRVGSGLGRPHPCAGVRACAAARRYQ